MMPIAADRMFATNAVALRASEKLKNVEQLEAESRGKKEKERTMNGQRTKIGDQIGDSSYQTADSA